MCLVLPDGSKISIYQSRDTNGFQFTDLFIKPDANKIQFTQRDGSFKILIYHGKVGH